MNAPARAAETSALTTRQEEALSLQPVMSPGSTALILDPRHMTQMMALAEVMARGVSTVPRHLQKNQGDCLAVVMQATQWGMNPFAVAQKTHVVNGTLGYEAQLVNAVVNTMAPTKDRLNYEWFGDWSKVMGKFEERQSKKKIDEDTGKPLTYRVPNWKIQDEADLGVKVWATMKGEDQPRELRLLLVQCRVRNSPLWADDPRQQIAYLAVKRWTRLHCPDVLLGVYTPDELDERTPRDMGAAEVVKTAIPEELLQAAEVAAVKGVAAYQKFWTDTGKDNRKTLDAEHARLKGIAAQADKERTVDNSAPPPPAPAPAAATSQQVNTAETEPGGKQADDGLVVTYAHVMDRMTKAKTPDALNEAADLIKSVADEAQRVELQGKYEQLSKEMEL